MESPTLNPPLPRSRSGLHPPTTDPPSAPSMTTSLFVAGHLSPPQISRVCAAATRISVARGDIWDGFHVWHSLRWSNSRRRAVGSISAPPPFRSPSPSVLIDLGRPVPTRLAAHCLLHSLLRTGKTYLAAKLTEFMMADREKLHPLSFGTLLSRLNFESSKSPQVPYGRLRILTPTRKVHLGPTILVLKSVKPNDQSTRIAVRLLNKAGKQRWQRTTGMYESALQACLIQGEIIVASLLLALLLKDYQLRHACSGVTMEGEKVGVQDTTTYIHSKTPEAPSHSLELLRHHSSHLLYQRITEVLVKHCPLEKNPSFPEASQALAILASELDARRIPYANLGTLIKAMHSYPRCLHTVWITLPSGERRLCNAYRYFNEVLLDLLSSFPDQESLDSNTSRLPSLDVESYNALLRYALRSRHSLAFANRVLHHMTELHKPPLAPNASTYNILLRSSTLMRRNDIAESVLQIMHWQTPDNNAGVHRLSLDTIQGRNSLIESSPTGSRLGGRRRFSKLLEDTRRYELNIPKPKEPLELDNTLLVSYMAHLVATGRPDMVASLITRVIPKFELPEEGVPPEEVIARWQTSVARGVTLGPYFFAEALNALRKAGHRRLAERVWALARAAETEALKSDVVAPWCLSVHAYTTMLRFYADETKGWGADHTVNCTKRTGHPPRLRDPIRAASAMRKGMQVFRDLSLAAVKVHDADVQARKEGREWKHPPTPPRVDARFYNSALSLIRRPGMRPCGSHRGSRWWNNLLAKARQRFLLTGHRPRGWTPELEEIRESLRSSGYTLPIGFELPFVGRDEQVPSRDRTDFYAQPYSFGERARARFRPHRLPTLKRKGLPLCNQWRRYK
jgi:hypothetical protein